MAIVETAKKIAEQVTGCRRPDRNDLPRLIRARKANTARFKDDGVIPNHPRWPLVVYRTPVRLPGALDPAAVFEEIFAENGWGSSWRDGIYDYVHYHSRIHEVLGIARGNAKVRFGGMHGRTFRLNAGDVAILPAGTGHQCLGASGDFLVVGAYPSSGTYDECTTSEDHARAVEMIAAARRPRNDPVYGIDGPLLQTWKT